MTVENCSLGEAGIHMDYASGLGHTDPTRNLLKMERRLVVLVGTVSSLRAMFALVVI
jgi:hypothetical protein